MDLKRISLIYASTYLLAAGIRLALVPSLALRLIFSNGQYGDVLPRVAGIRMILLGGLVSQIVWQRIETLYRMTVVLRFIALVGLFALYVYSRDPAMLVVFTVVLAGVALTVTGLLQSPPSISAAARSSSRRSPEARHE